MKKFFKFLIIFLFIIFILLILCITLIFINNIIMENSEKNALFYDRGISIVPQADYIVVPGAKIYSMPLQDRLDYAYKLYEANKASKIIISGGFDEEEAKYETLAMYLYLVDLGVPSENIISDVKGDNTYSTLKRVKDYVGDKSVIFCTQELYAYRASYIAKHLGLNMTIFCSNPVIYTGQGKAYIRESLARVKAVLNCTLFVPSVYSLEDIPFYEGGIN